MEIPIETCILNGGKLVHTSFTNHCLPFNDEFPKIEFFGIPQCVPESCGLDEAKHFWKDNIKKDFEELGFPMDECSIKLNVDTKLPKKRKAAKAPKKSKAVPGEH